MLSVFHVVSVLFLWVSGAPAPLTALHELVVEWGYQEPWFGIEAQGSAGGSAGPRCRSSIECPSGDFTNAMWPSRGGRRMSTPPACSRAQVA